MFPHILEIDDLHRQVAHKKEIKFSPGPNDTICVNYAFSDVNTFDNAYTLECRGIMFNRDGKVISRPLHKFFNAGENSATSWESLKEKKIRHVFEKLDGSMIASAYVDGEVKLRSKRSFNSDVVRLAYEHIAKVKRRIKYEEFLELCAKSGITAIFELCHPDARIVVKHDKPSLNLLHMRFNDTGHYIDRNVLEKLAKEHNIPLVKEHKLGVENSVEFLHDMLGEFSKREGFVVQFEDESMVKLKCAWYLRLHRSVTFLRERDIARAALHGDLDDIKSALQEIGISIDEVNAIETSVTSDINQMATEIEQLVKANSHLERKEFAIKHKEHPLFGLIMHVYNGKQIDWVKWYEANVLKEKYSLRALASETLMESL